MEIEQFIHYGKDNAVSRKELSRLTGISDDRKIRDMVKQANKRLEAQGEAILSSSGSRGYWRSTSIEEMETYLLEADHRRRSQAINDDPIRRIVARAKGYESIPVRAHFRRIHKKSQLDGQTTL